MKPGCPVLLGWDRLILYFTNVPFFSIGLTTAHSWETLVIFALNFKELNVHMNMGNVMGNVDWISRNFKSEGRLSIGSTGHKNMFITLALTSSKLEAKAGIVGGNLLLVY